MPLRGIHARYGFLGANRLLGANRFVSEYRFLGANRFLSEYRFLRETGAEHGARQ
jgi:hypothetical protein